MIKAHICGQYCTRGKKFRVSPNIFGCYDDGKSVCSCSVQWWLLMCSQQIFNNAWFITFIFILFIYVHVHFRDYGSNDSSHRTCRIRDCQWVMNKLDTDTEYKIWVNNLSWQTVYDPILYCSSCCGRISFVVENHKNPRLLLGHEVVAPPTRPVSTTGSSPSSQRGAACFNRQTRKRRDCQYLTGVRWFALIGWYLLSIDNSPRLIPGHRLLWNNSPKTCTQCLKQPGS